jgi:hypothetical protein
LSVELPVHTPAIDYHVIAFSNPQQQVAGPFVDAWVLSFCQIRSMDVPAFAENLMMAAMGAAGMLALR